MTEEHRKIPRGTALDLPLIMVRNGRKIIHPFNLNKRFTEEINSYGNDYINNRHIRGLLSIEEQDMESVWKFSKKASTAIQKYCAEGPNAPLEYDEAINLAQYLSWSFYNATEHSITDQYYHPQTNSTKGLKLLYVILFNHYKKPAGVESVINPTG